MKRNRIAIVLVVLMGSISLWFILHNGNTTLKKGLRNFALEDTTHITKLFLADKNNNTITLEKQRPGIWRLNGKFYARNDAVNMVLGTMKIMEVKSPVGKNGREGVLKSLATGGVKVEAYEGDKLVKLFYVGSETPDFMGTYMLLADPETQQNSIFPYVVYIPGFDGFLTPRFFTGENEWRDRTIFHYIPPEIKSIKVEFPPKPENGFEITNLPGSRFEVRSSVDNLPLQHIDTMSVMQYVSYFQNIQYELIEKLSKSFKDSVQASTPISKISVTDTKGQTNTIKVFYRNPGPKSIDATGKPAKYDPDRIFALINNGNDFVTIQFYVFGKLLEPIAYFTPRNFVKR